MPKLRAHGTGLLKQSHRRPIRRGLEVALAAVVVTGTLAAPAVGSFPGRNGVIAYQTNDHVGPSGISTIDPITGAAQQIISDGGEPAWSADGARLAFVRAGGIWVANANGSRQKRLTSGSIDRAPAWSPDGRRITFSRDNGVDTAIWVMRSNGKNPSALVSGSEPSWSPDGRRIAFYDDVAVWTMSSDGTNRSLLASRIHFPEDPADVTWTPEKPDWSPDGREIVVQYTFDGPCDGCFKLLRVAAGGGEPVMVPESYPAGAPSWSPDGTEIAAHSVEGLRSLAVGDNAASGFLLLGEFFDYTFPSWQAVPDHGRHP